MHHMFDETPNDAPLVQTPALTTHASHAIYSTHVGMLSPDREADTASVDLSQYRCAALFVENFITLTSCSLRHRGFKIGSLMIGTEDPELYYKQAGHPLSAAAKRGGAHQVCC